MPSRLRMESVPVERWQRVRWLDDNMGKLLSAIPVDRWLQGWTTLSQLEQLLLRTVRTVSEWLGGPLDPRCPECGVETDEGTVTRQDDRFLVSYQCGHQRTMTEGDLRARVLAS